MADEKPQVTATIVGMTDVGRVREHNEDNFLVLNRADGKRTASGETLRVDLHAAVLAVCDGMGGAAAGEVASQMAADGLAGALGQVDFASATPDQVAAMMDKAVHTANDAIFAESRANIERKGMGTTVTAAVAVPGRMYISQVGDSRGYLLRKGKLVQLTKDQSLIGQLIEEGTLTEEEAEKLGGRNIVLQAVGVEENLRVDTKHWEVLRGDVFLLCSDGLSGMIKDEEMEEILNAAGDDLLAASEQLIKAANEAGGRDNITSVLIGFEGEGLRPPMEAAGAADGVQRAGAGYQTPEVPEAKDPMKKVGIGLMAIIAVIALLFFVLRRTTADVSVAWRPTDVDVQIQLSDVDGNAIGEAITASGGSHVFAKLDLGTYTFITTATGYYDAEKTLPVEAAADVSMDVRLAPRPGHLSIRVATPHVSIFIEATGSDGNPFEKTLPWADPGTPAELDKVPAGDIRVVVSRTGFGDREQSEVMPPAGVLDLSFDALDEVKGTLRVEAPAGFAVVIVDERGDTLAELTSSGSVQDVEVREGRHQVRATKAGYEEFSRSVDVSRATGPTVVRVTAEVEQVWVSFVARPNTKVHVLRVIDAAGATEEALPEFIVRGTGLKKKPLAPGKYVAESAGGRVPFELKAGDPAKRVEIR